ncbi:MAG: YbaN family protein [Syntrophotaleaceae bacterium]
MKEPLRVFLIIVGTLCVALSVLGMFLPALPTTPFLLLAASCYARSSEKFYQWLITNRWFGEYIRNYREGRGMPLKQKVITIVLLWLTIGSTARWAISQWWMRSILLGIAVGVTVFLVKVKTYRPQAKPDPSPSEDDPPSGGFE